ncbi:hypothetical protein TWF217_001504 [Orbilia oligospora]|nr:hypothetical protein TWF217_001504 [Orbilia oligospora]KAF3292217.1 hypothetical protein TWF132_005886 [Orbilia oligospora]KAF3292218.1 hypothetical protein TWF132_005886 [Orbilia oligospora]
MPLHRLRISQPRILLRHQFCKFQPHPFILPITTFRTSASSSRLLSTTTMSSQKIAIRTDKAPPPFPVYNQAILHDKTVYVSGQLGMDPETKQMLEGPIAVRAEQALKNLGAVLEAAGSNMNQVLKVVVFLVDMKDFQEVNSVYEKFFGDVKPARSCIAVHQLPLGTDVEIECIAHV